MTPAGGVDASATVGIRLGSRGLFELDVVALGKADLQRRADGRAGADAVALDDRRRPSASAGAAARARTPAASTRAPASSAPTREIRSRMPDRVTELGMTGRRALQLFTSRSGITPIGMRHRRRIDRALHRRQILEHEVPLPALRRIRRLQPVPRGDRAAERELRRSPRIRAAARTAPRCRRGRAAALV